MVAVNLKIGDVVVRSRFNGSETARRIVAALGSCLCVFWGPTPASRGGECRAASKVNVVGQVLKFGGAADAEGEEGSGGGGARVRAGISTGSYRPAAPSGGKLPSRARAAGEPWGSAGSRAAAGAPDR